MSLADWTTVRVNESPGGVVTVPMDEDTTKTRMYKSLNGVRARDRSLLVT